MHLVWNPVLACALMMDDDLQFTSFLTVCQSYQDDWRVIVKDCVQWMERFPPPTGLEPGTTRSAG